LKILNLFLLVFFLFVQVCFSSDNEVLTIKNGSSFPLADHLSLLVDKEGKFSYQDIVSKYKEDKFKHFEGILSRGFSSDVYWLHFKLKNEKDADSRLYLIFGAPYLDDVVVYNSFNIQNNNDESYKSVKLGDHYKGTSNTLKHLMFVVPLIVSERGETDVFVRIKTTSAMYFNGVIVDETGLNRSVIKHFLMKGLFMGMILLVILFHLIIYFRVRRKYHLYFSIVSLSIFFNMSSGGFLYLIVPAKYLMLTDWVSGFSIGMFIFSLSIFAMNVFETKTEFPKLDILLKIFVIYSVFLALSPMVGLYRVIAPTYPVLGIVLVLTLLWISIYLVKNNKVGGRIYLIAFSISTVGYVITLLNILGIVELKVFLDSADIFRLSSVFDQVLMSVALTEQFISIEKEMLNSAKDAETKAVEIARNMTVELKNKNLELENMLEEKVRFLDMISHEYRNPLAIIQVNVDLINNKDKEGRFSNKIEKMRKATKRLAGLMEDALNRQRFDFAYVDHVTNKIDIKDLIVDTIAEINSFWSERNIICDFPDETIFINGDADLLKTALINIIQNAIKYSSDNSDINMTLFSDSDTCCIIVKDEGEGILEEDINRVFDKFYRGHRSSDVPGAGLGLNITKGIIASHNGSIEIKSEKNKGTAVYVRMPIAGD